MLPRHVGGRYPTPGILVARHGIEPCPPAFQTSTLPSSSRANNLVDGARLELAFHGCRPWVIPLYEPPNWVSQRERRLSASSWRGHSSLSAEPSYKRVSQ